jgi:hypothetical protein
MMVVTWSLQVCLANNNLFLPGDAFFPTMFTKADIEALQKAKSGERKFAYSSLGGYEGAFCGYAGYANATIPAVDDEFAKNLARAYDKIREFDGRKLIERTTDGKTELIETNGIRVLFYPPEFKFPEHALGLRYNENWVAECMKFGHRRKDLRLCPLIADPEAVAISWRDADLVPGLKADLPKVPLKPVPRAEEPVVVRGPVKAFVFGSLTLKEIFQCKQEDVLTVYLVDSKGITKLVHEDGKWNPHDFE